MVSQLQWEKDIIWDGEEAKEKVLNSKASELAGWVPTLAHRTALQFYSHKGHRSVAHLTNAIPGMPPGAGAKGTPGTPLSARDQVNRLKQQILNSTQGTDVYRNFVSRIKIAVLVHVIEEW